MSSARDRLEDVVRQIAGGRMWLVAYDGQPVHAASLLEARLRGEARWPILFLRTALAKTGCTAWNDLIGRSLEALGLGRAPRVGARERDECVEVLRALPPEGAFRWEGVRLELDAKEEPRKAQEIAEARERLVNWANLEAVVDRVMAGELGHLEDLSFFSRIVGGLRPLVVVLDDYNCYVSDQFGAFQPLDQSEIQGAAKGIYRVNGNYFHSILTGHCKFLNNLRIGFNVAAPKLWIDSSKQRAGYQEVSEALPFSFIESHRGQISAFIVDLEWSPTVVSREPADEWDWDEAGLYAIHLLSQRFPEIPSFVYTGLWTNRKRQEALAKGAAWCFAKHDSHHPYLPDETTIEPLTCVTLECQLQSEAISRSWAFPDFSKRDQLDLDPGDSASQELVRRFGLGLPLVRTARGRALLGLVGRLFPDGSRIQPAKILGSGRSSAKATLFVAVERAGRTLATRFLKIASWQDIEEEARHYEQVVRPRLGSFTAQVVGPAAGASATDEMPLGALMYSVVGLPEAHQDLQSLDERLEACRRGEENADELDAAVGGTLERVLRHLYSGSGPERRRRRPLWAWLGEVLPAAYTGALLTLDPDLGEEKSRTVVQTRRETAGPLGWILASRDLMQLCEVVPNPPEKVRASPWKGPAERVVSLRGFRVLEAKWEGGTLGEGEVVLAHPELGVRFRLRGQSSDVRRRFGAPWIRKGMSADVLAVLDPVSEDIERIRERLLAALENLGLLERIAGAEFADPLTLFNATAGIPFHMTIEATEGAIHGDLNPRNILFSKHAEAGWLIDFDKSIADGMVAFDLAKLEVEIWHHHLAPLFEQYADIVFPGDPAGVLLFVTAVLRTVGTDIDPGASIEFALGGHQNNSAKLVRPVADLVAIVRRVRRFAKDLSLTPNEVNWAIGCYSFASIKFAKPTSFWKVVTLWRLSAWCLNNCGPDFWQPTTPESMRNLCGEIDKGQVSEARRRKVDGLLLAIQRRGSVAFSANELALAMAPSPERRPVWPEDVERWDLGSTGSVGNITPILGYLWLRAKAWQSIEGNRFRTVVPKISSSGTSGGTVDILESGGLSFPVDPAAIVHECLRVGGVLCCQDVTPVDQIFMERRRDINAMKDAVLTYASILSKKVAMGCTHAVVDLKLGWDTKLLSALMEPKENEKLSGAIGSGLDPSDETRELVNKLLEEISGVAVEWQADRRFFRQAIDDGSLGSVQEVRWFITNADRPQSRAVGRHLTLIFLEGLLEGSWKFWGHDEIEERGPLLDRDGHFGQGELASWLRRTLTHSCEIEGDVAGLLRRAWRELRDGLWRMKELPAARILNKWLEPRDPVLEREVSLARITESGAYDLAFLSLPFAPYSQHSLAPGSLQVDTIDTYRLDELFGWLCGPRRYDPEVGLWLHRLPGEEVERPREMPGITAFYHPSLHSHEEIITVLRDYMTTATSLRHAGA